jgi:hypothetical protein
MLALCGEQRQRDQADEADAVAVLNFNKSSIR